MKKALKVLKAGKLKIGENEIPCFVLDDEKRTRAISGRGMTTAIGIKGRGQGMARIFAQKNIIPFISNELRLAIETPFSAIGTTSRKANPTFLYEGTVLHDLCEAVLLARDAGALKAEWEKRYARFAEAAIRSFSKVGIIALIDEATGYQYDRPRDELNRLLALYLSEERLKWAKMFPDEFYKLIYKLKNWPFPGGTKRTPLIGQITNKIVYEKLPPGVLEKLRELNPKNPKTNRRSAKHFQHLSSDIGQDDLRGHLLQVIALLRASSNWRIFERLFARAFPTKEQLEEQRQQRLPGVPEPEDEY